MIAKRTFLAGGQLSDAALSQHRRNADVHVSQRSVAIEQQIWGMVQANRTP